jgi:hypothetical protein
MGFDRVEDLLMDLYNQGKDVYDGVMKISTKLETNKYRDMADKFEHAYEIYKEKNNGPKKKKAKNP